MREGKSEIIAWEGGRRDVVARFEDGRWVYLRPAFRTRMMRLRVLRLRFEASLTEPARARRRLLREFGLTRREIAWPVSSREACAVIAAALVHATFDEVGLRRWLREQNASLDGLTPVSAMRRGRYAAVRDAFEAEMVPRGATASEQIPIRPLPT